MAQSRQRNTYTKTVYNDDDFGWQAPNQAGDKVQMKGPRSFFEEGHAEKFMQRLNDNETSNLKRYARLNPFHDIHPKARHTLKSRLQEALGVMGGKDDNDRENYAKKTMS